MMCVGGGSEKPNISILRNGTSMSDCVVMTCALCSELTQLCRSVSWWWALVKKVKNLCWSNWHVSVGLCRSLWLACCAPSWHNYVGLCCDDVRGSRKSYISVDRNDRHYTLCFRLCQTVMWWRAWVGREQFWQLEWGGSVTNKLRHNQPSLKQNQNLSVYSWRENVAITRFRIGQHIYQERGFKYCQWSDKISQVYI